MRIAAVIGAILLLLVVGTFCTVGRRTHHLCLDCGLYFQDRVMFGIPLPEFAPKPRTLWYVRRIGTAHTHRWGRLSCSSGLNVWNRPTYFTCGSADRVTRHSDDLASVLLRLEPLGLDRQLHAAITHATSDHRDAAVVASLALNIEATDEEVLAWWSKTEKFLASPDAWSAGSLYFGK